MRLFVAIDLSQETSALLRLCRRQFPEQRWVKPEQLHLTLAFMANLPPPLLPALQESLAQIRQPAFVLTFTASGWFPSVRHPLVGWLGVEPAPELLALKDSVDQALRSLGVTVGERPFMPHLTLLWLSPRRRSSSDLPSALSALCSPWIGRQCRAHEFRLLASELHPAGAIHRLLSSYPLTP